MDNDSRLLNSRPAFRPLLFCVVLAYSAWSIWLALRHGLFVSGALGDYSLFVYVLVLGMLCSGFVFAQAQSGGRAVFIMLFLAFGGALARMEPVRVVPSELRWLFDLVGYVAAFAVVAAGLVLESRVHGRG